MQYLFIDTNILLSFYHFTNDDLEELKKLAALVRQGELLLILTEQVIDEFHRNRANKILDALKKLRNQRLNLQFPQISKDYEEFERIRVAQREYSRLHAELLDKIEQDVHSSELKADSVIEELFQLATVVETSDDIVARARLRMELGNPPGKQGSLGDAVNWEILLDYQDLDYRVLFFITEDGDYHSPLDRDEMDPFLVREWDKLRRGSIVLYKRLSQFFKDHYPHIELDTELEKEKLIQALAQSDSFARTHEVIARLSSYSDFTDAQINEIAAAAVLNNQVYWIIDDPDVRDFLISTISERELEVDYELRERLNAHFEEKVFSEPPF